MNPLRVLLLFVAVACVIVVVWSGSLVRPTPPHCPTPDAWATWQAAAVRGTEIEDARRADALRARPNRRGC